MFIGEWNKSVILTYVGMAFAILGIYCACTEHIQHAYACLIVAGVCDLFDGAVARRCKRNDKQKLFGIQLDSLVDVMSFIALPVAICIGMGMEQWYHMLIFIVFGICGIARLAYFNVNSDSTAPVAYYQGIPVTYTALILPVAYLLKLIIPWQIFLIVYSVIVVCIAGLQILNVKVVKPRGLAYVFFALLAVVMLVVFLGGAI